MSDATGHLWVEEGDVREGAVAEVAPLIPTSRTYLYAIPDDLEKALRLGHRVRVPVGRGGKLVQGFVVSLDRRMWRHTSGPIHSLVDDESFLTTDLIALGREIALHYACPLGRTLKAITPEAVRRRRGFKTVRYARMIAPAEAIRDDRVRKGAKQQALIDQLAGETKPVPVARLLRLSGASTATLHGLVKKGWVEITTQKEARQTAVDDHTLTEPGFELNTEQRAAIGRIHEAIDAGCFSVTLLFGVSGSGKTEVYIRAMRHVIARGQQAILLVPEIALTTQLLQRLTCRFSRVAVHHSGLTGVQRSCLWREVLAGERNVVIGTRSAVFAPCRKLGLICVDEEQETSYKNLRAPRFHVRDVAIMRAKQLNIPIVLGSATPAVETWYHSKHRKDYQRVEIRHRVARQPLPTVYKVDMNDEFIQRKREVVLSRTTERLLTATLDRGEQALLLVNRRGFATRLYCPACRTGLTCPNCSAPLVVHHPRERSAGTPPPGKGQSICHYCRHRIDTPTVCPNVTCGEKLLSHGTGTQRVEEVLGERFPQAHIQRVDSDTMKHRDQYRKIIQAFEQRHIDVLIGTQMIAKGLDFPFVSFVCVLRADPTSLSGDFRAQERLFQFITQTAGRAGRGKTPGQVVVQTTTPDLPALEFALRHDYESFVSSELRTRRRVALPPFCRLTRIVLAHHREETARHEAEAMLDRIQTTIGSLSFDPLQGGDVPLQGGGVPADVLGPTPCILRRLRGRYRYDLLLRTPSASAMRQLIRKLQESNALRTKAESTIVDVDPVSLT